MPADPNLRALSQHSLPRLPFVSLGLAPLVLASAFAAQTPPAELMPFVGAPGTFYHEPAGALATGNTTLSRVGDVFHFNYTETGGETIDYTVDLNNASVLKGLIHVEETALTNGAVLVEEGGLTWRNSTTPDNYVSPWAHANSVMPIRFHVTWDTRTRSVMLGYRELNGTTPTVKYYVYSLVGKVLKVRAFADRTVNDAYVGNYTGFLCGKASGLPQVREQHIPYMDSVPLFVFNQPSGQPLFLARFLDLARSNGSEMISEVGSPSGGSLTFSFGTNYYNDNAGKLLAPVDETLNIVVSSKVETTFPLVNFGPSPYRDFLAGHMHFTGSGDGLSTFTALTEGFQKLSAWGVDDLRGMLFFWDKYGHNMMSPEKDAAAIMCCDAADIVPEPGSYPVQVWYGTPLAQHSHVVTAVDPSKPANKSIAKTRLQNLMQALRNGGFSTALYQDNGNLDPQGYGPYQHQGDLDYPLSSTTPLTQLSYGLSLTNPNAGFGLLVPAQNVLYPSKAYRRVLESFGGPKSLWTTTDNFVNTSWNSMGHALSTVSPFYLLEHWTQEIATAKVDYAPNGAFIDATTDVPGKWRTDEIQSSPCGKTIWKNGMDERDALLAHKRNLGGPLLGENAHRRFWENSSAESGLWDGRHRKFPVDVDFTHSGDGASVDPLKPNRDSWVIPDYELERVLPVASGHHGMGWESEHGVTTAPPYDGINGDVHDFFDSFVTNELTYGHAGYFSTNGFVPNNYWTQEGVLRQYFLVSAAHRAMVKEHVLAVEYQPLAGGAFVDLTGALKTGSGIDLKNPHVRITYSNNLVLWANHDVVGGAPWPVVVADKPPGQAQTAYTISLPPNGFALSNLSGLLVFSGTPSGAPARIEYARSPGNYEALCGRANATGGQTFLNFPPASLTNLLPAPPTGVNAWNQHLVVRNDLHHLVLGAVGGRPVHGTGTWVTGRVETAPLNGTAPSPQSLTIQSQGGVTSVAEQRELGFTAWLEFGLDANGSPIRRDVTPMVQWTATPVTGTAPATINGDGVVLGAALGSVNVQATWTTGATIPSNVVLVVVTRGAPTAQLTPNSPVGSAGFSLSLSSDGSTDPEGDRLSGWWSFGDGTPKVAGLRTRHAWHAPGTYTLKANVTDREGTTATATTTATIDDAGISGLLWADEFDDSMLDGWQWSAAQAAFGLLDGGLVQSFTSSSASSPLWQVAAIAGESWTDLIVESDVTLTATSNVTSAGIHVRRANDIDTPANSGYYVGLQSDGNLVILEAGSLVAGPLSYGSAGSVHHLMVRVDDFPSNSIKLFVYVDGQLLTSIRDVTPQAGGGVALVTDNQKGRFESVVVRTSP